ncbi:hypothetical protein PMAYCL1PPCAC_26382 [Pristionchus mayeri]|uniref:Uncharacterized protein n=1 Tax=Pristionchus mayeri TaxID=1317129 RepID=A0AAN5I855_9BILA|nr:hypothetical protein PMAYCL1PPCAC_26382 [Pristionchus mayeri]
MTSLRLALFFILFTVALGQDGPCVDFSSVCVPVREMEQGCRCALIRQPSMLESEDDDEDLEDDVQFKILSQKAVDELNRFFRVNESQPAPVDSNVFATVHDTVHTHLMTFPTSILDKIVRSQEDWLSPKTRQHLINCGGPRCEVVKEATDLQGNPPPTRPDRAFRVTRALRYDIEGEDRTLLAIASATSDFVLTKQKVRVCKHTLFWKTCHDEWRLRVFDDASRANWMNHVNKAMVGMFRTDNGNLLV